MQYDQVLVGRYRLTELLGAGGAVVVWQAHDEMLNQPVAVKILADSEASDPQDASRMLAEAQAAASIAHPHLVNVVDYGESLGPQGEPLPFVVMEMVTGPSLAEPGVADGLPPREALAIGWQVAQALTALHERGLVHRDIKPRNVMLTPDGVKIIDFEIAAIIDALADDERGKIVGTPSYLAPERLLGNPVTPAADVYALGVLIYWLLAQRLPWPTRTEAETVRAHMLVEPLPLPPMEGVPADVADLCRRCLEKDPHLRPSAAEVTSVLASATRHTADEFGLAAWRRGRHTIAAFEADHARRRRRYSILAASAFVAAVLGAIAILPSTGWLGDASDTDAVAPTGSTAFPADADGVASGSGTPTVGTEPTPSTSGAVNVPSPAIPIRTTPPGSQTVTALGGTVRIICQGNTPNVQSAQPAAGFSASPPDPGPGGRVQVTFTSATHESEIRARCGPHGLVPSITESALAGT